MNSLLLKFLKKRGVEDIRELSEEESATYEQMDNVLSGTLTLEKMLEFFKSQKSIIETKYTDPDNSDKKDSYLKASLSIYNTLIKMIESPEAQRIALEKFLIEQLKEK